MKLTLRLGDSLELLKQYPEASIHAVMSDPPYGLEFSGTDGIVLEDSASVGGFQDGKRGNPYSRTRVRIGTGNSWQTGGGFSKLGIGVRQIPVPSFSATSRFGTANPTCSVCGGRLRGAKKCSCEEPQWKPIGKRRNPENEGLPDTMTGTGMSSQLNALEAWHKEWLGEVYRVLVPGGVIKAFSSSRTMHLLAQAMESVGFTDINLESYSYGSGFPKNQDMGKAFDRMAGAVRPIIGKGGRTKTSSGELLDITAPVTKEAVLWDGWGTALKPAWEPIVIGTKP